jgi:hypothetical protein
MRLFVHLLGPDRDEVATKDAPATSKVTSRSVNYFGALTVY